MYINKFHLARQAELFCMDFCSSHLPRFDLCKGSPLDHVNTKWKQERFSILAIYKHPLRSYCKCFKFKLHRLFCWLEFMTSRPGQIARPMSIGRAKPLRRAQFISWANFALEIKKNQLDLQIYSRIGKTMKRLYWILNTFENTSTLVIFWFFIYLMASKLLYILMDWVIFNSIMADIPIIYNQSIDLLCKSWKS